MHINPVRSLGALRSSAGVADGSCGVIERVRPYDAQTSKGAPMVRVIEGELLDKDSGPAGYDVARRWLLNNTARPSAADDADLYTRRAHLAIGTYLDTAIMSGPRGATRAGLDLYA
jgi:hypothetical protein